MCPTQKVSFGVRWAHQVGALRLPLIASLACCSAHWHMTKHCWKGMCNIILVSYMSGNKGTELRVQGSGRMPGQTALTTAGWKMQLTPHMLSWGPLVFAVQAGSSHQARQTHHSPG